MSSSPCEKLWNGDEDVATPFHAGAVSRCALVDGGRGSAAVFAVLALGGGAGVLGGDDEVAAKHGPDDAVRERGGAGFEPEVAGRTVLFDPDGARVGGVRNL
jgi:hypothetical protein